MDKPYLLITTFYNGRFGVLLNDVIDRKVLVYALLNGGNNLELLEDCFFV